MIKWHLEAMYGSIESGIDEEGTLIFRVMENVDVKKLDGQQILLEWVGGSLSDMVADSVLALLLGMDHSPATVKCTFLESLQKRYMFDVHMTHSDEFSSPPLS